MKKVSLVEAYKILHKYKSKNAYVSSKNSTLEKDIEYIEKIEHIFKATKTAERASGILEYKEQLDALEYELEFYSVDKIPLNINIENIDKYDKELIKQKYLEASSQREYILEKLNSVSKNTYIKI